MVHLVTARNLARAIAHQRLGILLISSSFLWGSLAVHATTGSRGTACETVLRPKAQFKTDEDLFRFVDYRGLEAAPDEVLELQIAATLRFNQRLAMQTATLAQQIVHLNFLVTQFLSLNQDALALPHENPANFKRSIGYYEAADRIFEHQKLILKVGQHLAALERMVDRRKRWIRKDPYRQDLKIEARLCVAGKPPSELVAEILQLVDSTGLSSNSVVFRFFDSSREDLVRLNGTDRAGDRILHSPTSLNGLPDHSLNANQHFVNEFYGLDASGLRFGQFGHRPYPMINDFIGGTKSIAIYTASRLRSLDHESYGFRRFSKRTSSLVGILTPTTRPPCN